MSPIRLFIAHPSVLGRYRLIVPAATAHYLTPGATLAVLPFDDRFQDACHRANGTGEWLDDANVQLTATDLAFAAKTSNAGPIAYVEIDTAAPDTAYQSAVLWAGGSMIMRPASMLMTAAANRPRVTWPVNAALRGLGLKAIPGHDETESAGLDQYRDLDDILTHAPRAFDQH